MKDRLSNKSRIIICIVVLLIIYSLFCLLALKSSSNISHFSDTQGLITVFPAQYLLLLTMAMGVILMYLRSLLSNRILRVLLIYMALVNFLAALCLFVLILKFILSY